VALTIANMFLKYYLP